MIGRTFQGEPACLIANTSANALRQPARGRPNGRVVDLELAHRYTFCGGPSDATLGCSDETAPLIFQGGVSNSCLVDCVTRRFREVKHRRIGWFVGDIVAAVPHAGQRSRT